MADPFLLAHHAGPLVFNLSGKLVPVSIRDQMVRGRLFVDRAVEEGVITPGPDTGLLVVGGGACGATAAIRAAERQVHATLVEASPRLFRAQAGCPTRWIDPAQYDWPLDHWAAGGFPVAGLPMPLPWTAARADTVAVGWRALLAAAIARFGTSLLDVRLRSRPTIHSPPGSPFVQATIVTPAGSVPRRFGAVLVTVGFGLEDTSAPPHYTGLAFWEPDLFQQPNVGLPHGVGPRVTISGAGDGALQDFIRILSGLESVRDFVQACGLPGDVAKALKDLDRCVAAAFHWGATTEHDHPLHTQLDAECRAQANAALADPAVARNLDGLLAGRSSVHLRLVHRCVHLTPYYLLNRFAVLLVDEHFQRKHGFPLLIPRASVAEVKGASPHSCSSPANCHGQPHDVVFKPWPDCRFPARSGRAPVGASNVVIIRHGIRPTAPPFANLTPLAQPRQVLPFYLM